MGMKSPFTNCPACGREVILCDNPMPGIQSDYYVNAEPVPRFEISDVRNPWRPKAVLDFVEVYESHVCREWLMPREEWWENRQEEEQSA